MTSKTPTEKGHWSSEPITVDEKAHWAAVKSAGFKSGVVGLSLGLGGVIAASRRFPSFNKLTIPLKTFLVTSSGTAFAIIAADHASVRFERENNPRLRQYNEQAAKIRAQAKQNATGWENFVSWGRENRYSIVFASWLVGMGASWQYVNRDKGMTFAQKIVQARVYAQAVTLAVLLATALFEVNDARKGEGLWETILVADPENPDHLIEKRVQKEAYTGADLWKDMVAAEEKRIAERKRRGAEIQAHAER